MDRMRKQARLLQEEATAHYRRAGWWREQGAKLLEEAQGLAYRAEEIEMAERAPAATLVMMVERERQIEARAPSFVGED